VVKKSSHSESWNGGEKKRPLKSLSVKTEEKEAREKRWGNVAEERASIEKKKLAGKELGAQ